MIIMKKMIFNLFRIFGFPFVIIEAVCTGDNPWTCLKRYNNTMHCIRHLSSGKLKED
jgi:hypothetical protein